MRAISSGVERHVDIVEVGGSKPPSPTRPGCARRRGPGRGAAAGPGATDKFLEFELNQRFPDLFRGFGSYRIRVPRFVRCRASGMDTAVIV